LVSSRWVAQMAHHSVVERVPGVASAMSGRRGFVPPPSTYVRRVEHRTTPAGLQRGQGFALSGLILAGLAIFADQSTRSFLSFPPSLQAWQSEHRQLVCIAENRDGSALHGSIAAPPPKASTEQSTVGAAGRDTPTPSGSAATASPRCAVSSWTTAPSALLATNERVRDGQRGTERDPEITEPISLIPSDAQRRR
jgi:hypothetical protein